MIWYRIEVDPRKSDAMLIYVSSRDPFSKINLRAIPRPIFFMYGLRFAETPQFCKSGWT
jgi:hypothetical protein